MPEVAARIAEALAALAARTPAAPALVVAVDAGLQAGVPFLAQEYVSDESLDVFLRRQGKLAPARAHAALADIARALDAAWADGLGHGALHPRDIFISADGDVRVSGVGVVQALESVGVRVPARRPYAAPERIEGRAWDRRADVYSLGVIAHDMLTGGRGGDVLSATSQPITRARADVPGDRYETAQALVDALRSDRDDAPARPVAPAIAPAPVDLGPPPIEIRSSRAIEIDVPARPVVDASSIPAGVTSEPAFPWAATVAVVVAGLVVGAVGGYLVGYGRGEAAALAAVAAPRVEAAPPASASADQPAGTPAVAPAPGVTPAAPARNVVQSPAARRTTSGRTPRAAAVLTGSLFVDSRPRGARVLIDGRAVGQTPKSIDALSPGDHRVLIELAGHRGVASTVKVVAGEQTRLAVTLELRGAAQGVAPGRFR